MIEPPVATSRSRSPRRPVSGSCRGCWSRSRSRRTARWPSPCPAAPSRTASGRSPWSGRSSGSVAAGPALGRLDGRRGRRAPPGPARRCRRRPGPAEADRDDRRDRRGRQLHGRHGAVAGRASPSSGSSRWSPCCIGMGMAFYYAAYSAWLPAIVPGVARCSPSTASRAWSVRWSPRPSARVSPVSSSGSLLPGRGLPGRGRRRRRRRRSCRSSSRGPRCAATSPTVDTAPGPRGDLATCARASSTCSRTPGCSRRCCSPRLMVLVTMGPFEVLVPFVVKDRLGGDAGDHALVLAAFGVGGAVGSLGDGVDADAASLPDLDEPRSGASPACRSS